MNRCFECIGVGETIKLSFYITLPKVLDDSGNEIMEASWSHIENSGNKFP